ncbi:MAG: 30S ribosomal protein S1 [Anaerolineales bacterium]|nr:MAG: 30S ribosomal protein S1 [Anaerolineales bacterium]
MVNKQTYKASRDSGGGPPPLDESWWEAVLAEDKQFRPAPGTQTVSAERKLPAQIASGDAAEVDWEYATELFSKDQVVTLEVTGHNRGGLLVNGERLGGFVPVSHLVDLLPDQPETEQEQTLASYQGKQLHLKIIESDEERGRVVFSERAAQTASGSRNLLLKNLQPAQCIEGTITNITDFGVFVDLGGVEGLIHVSELSWGRVRHPSDVAEFGDLVKVFVISVDTDRSRVALSLKRMYPNPWTSVETRYQPGQIAEATITSVVPFGAFARLEEGLDGLIHVSEIYGSDENASHKDLLYEGQSVKVRIIHIDAPNQRLGLSLIQETEATSANS